MKALLALLLVAVELAVVVAFATLFSSFATPFLAACYSVGLYLVGHLTRDLRALGAASDSELFATATAWIHRVFPDLSALNRLMASLGLAKPSAESAGTDTDQANYANPGRTG